MACSRLSPSAFETLGLTSLRLCKRGNRGLDQARGSSRFAERLGGGVGTGTQVPGGWGRQPWGAWGAAPLRPLLLPVWWLCRRSPGGGEVERQGLGGPGPSCSCLCSVEPVGVSPRPGTRALLRAHWPFRPGRLGLFAVATCASLCPELGCRGPFTDEEHEAQRVRRLCC